MSRFQGKKRRSDKQKSINSNEKKYFLFVYFFGGLESVGHSFVHVAHFILLRDVWIRTQRAASRSM